MPAYRVHFAGYVGKERYASLGIFSADDNKDAERIAPSICLQMIEMASDPKFRATVRRSITFIEDRQGNIIASDITL